MLLDMKKGFEHGFINAELIKKYAPEGDYSVFMCGPKAMYDFCIGECKKLGLKKRRYRAEMSGDYMNVQKNADFPKATDGRRLADKKFGWIHPCASFPMSDIELCVFPTQE